MYGVQRPVQAIVLVFVFSQTEVVASNAPAKRDVKYNKPFLLPTLSELCTRASLLDGSGLASETTPSNNCKLHYSIKPFLFSAPANAFSRYSPLPGRQRRKRTPKIGNLKK